MARRDGEKTRQRILEVAEELFAERGFDGTSVERIAQAAGVNKALIYYHFENKGHLVTSLFASILDELSARLDLPVDAPPADARALRRKLRGELAELNHRKRILAVMFMEALRSADNDDVLLRCADLVMRHEAHDRPGRRGRRTAAALQRYRVHEFFTGFVPLLAYVVLADKFCDHFDCDRDRLEEDFLDAFARSHLASHH